MVFRSLLLLPLALSSACAPLAAHDRLGELTTILGEAEREEAQKYARYEFTKASLYLDEARVKNGHGDYATAEAYATEGAEFARTALQTAKQRRDLERRRKRNEPLVPAAPPVTPDARPVVPDAPPMAPVTPPEVAPPTTPVTPTEVTPPVPPVEPTPPKKKLLPPGMGGGQ